MMTKRREKNTWQYKTKENSKFFFIYANKKFKNISAVGPLQDEEGKLEGDPTKMANILKDQYKKIFSTPCPEKIMGDPTSFFESYYTNADRHRPDDR